MFNLADAFDAVARRWPERQAIISDRLALTHAGLMKRSCQCAAYLATQGICQGDRVGLALTTNAETLVAVIALWRLGASPLISDFRSRGLEREHMCRALQLKCYIEDRVASGPGQYPAMKLPVDWEHLPARTVSASDPVHGTSLAVIGISSGTAGIPKPVALSHECLFIRYALARSSPQWRPGGVFVISASMSYSATRKHVLARLLDGGTVVFAPILASPEQLIELVHRNRASSLLIVPTIARMLMEQVGEGSPLFPHVDYLMCTGAPMSAAEKIAGIERLSPGLLQCYGSTMAGIATILPCNAIREHADSVGRAIDHVAIEIADGEGRALPVGEIGAVRVRTPGVGAEIGESPLEHPKSDLVIDGWLYPGDIGYLDGKGYLHVVGRSSDVIIRGGVNVYPVELESVIQSHPAVVEAAVVAWQDKVMGDEIVAFVTTRAPVEPMEIMAFCKMRLQPDKQPRHIFVVDDLPRNANGKVIKQDLIARQFSAEQD